MNTFEKWLYCVKPSATLSGPEEGRRGAGISFYMVGVWLLWTCFSMGLTRIGSDQGGSRPVASEGNQLYFSNAKLLFKLRQRKAFCSPPAL